MTGKTVDNDSGLYDLQDKVSIGYEVGMVLSTKGWAYIQSLIDRMITDTIGGKNGDRWLIASAKFSNTKIMTEKELAYLLGFRDGLAELNNAIHNSVSIAKEAQHIIDTMQQGNEYGDIS